MNSNLRQLARWRQAETGEKYMAARRAVMDDPAERARIMAAIRDQRLRLRYPFTDRDGLDGRCVLSAFETQRRAH